MLFCDESSGRRLGSSLVPASFPAGIFRPLAPQKHALSTGSCFRNDSFASSQTKPQVVKTWMCFPVQYLFQSEGIVDSVAVES